jgi:transposase
VEVITGVARRRRWTMDEKARIVAESLSPGANVSEVARRHDISRSLLFQWRRQLSSDGESRSADGSAPIFVPVTIAAHEPSGARTESDAPAEIEIEVDSIRIRIRGLVDEATLRVVLNAVRTTR